MTKYLLFLSTLITTLGASFGQNNLVPNWDFSKNTGGLFCLAGGEVNGAESWYMPTLGTSDAMNKCVTFPNSPSSIPTNAFGKQDPHSGDGYAGFFSVEGGTDEGYREYMQAELTSPLDVGKKYCIEMYISLADNATFATNGIGIHLSEKKISRTDSDPFGLKPTIEHGQVIKDKTNWVKVSGEWIATEPAKYVTIGNFMATGSPTIEGASSGIVSLPMPGAYYFVDAVKVIECTDEKDMVSVIANSNSVCPGSCVEITATNLSGSTDVSYSWNNGILGGAGPHQVCPNKTTKYTVILTDNSNGNKDTAEVTVDVTSSGTVSVKSTDEKCGNKNGVAEVVISGAGSYGIKWDNGATTSKLTGLSAGDYGVVITTPESCEISKTVKIKNEGAMSLVVNDQVFDDCDRFGANNGHATVTVTGGTPGYTYEWSTEPPQTTAEAKFLVPGETYSVTVTDTSGCTAQETFTVKEFIKVNVVAKVVPSCVTCDNGIIGIEPSGGTSPYTYRWDDESQSTTALIKGLKAGTYTVTVFDSTGCFTRKTVTIGVVGIADMGSLTNAINIYPNPANNILNIELPETRDQVLVKLYNLQGKLIFNKKFSAITGKINLTTRELSNGFYILELSGSTIHLVEKLQIADY